MREQKRAQRRRQRRILLGIFVIISIITIVFFMRPDNIEASEPIQVITVHVQEGDTLWRLADRYDNNTMDLREYIYIIERFNKLDHTVLQPGQKILIPVYQSEKTLALTSALTK